MRNIVEPFDVPNTGRTDPRSLFQDQRQALSESLEVIAGKSSTRRPYATFLEHALSDLDFDAVAELQRKWLRPQSLGSATRLLKFFDLNRWFETKFRIAQRLHLDKSASLRIVDIGTGPSHFGYLVTYFGHSVIGTDLPSHLVEFPQSAVLQLYKDFRSIFRVRCVEHVTTPSQPLPPDLECQQLVIALLIRFSEKQGNPWVIADWNSFLSGLRSTLDEEGRLYLQLNRSQTTEEAWQLLSGLADWSNKESNQLNVPATRIFEWLDQAAR
jgi:hypothetical protein